MFYYFPRDYDVEWTSRFELTYITGDVRVDNVVSLFSHQLDTYVVCIHSDRLLRHRNHMLVKPLLAPAAKKRVMIDATDIQHLHALAQIRNHLTPVRCDSLVSGYQLSTPIAKSIE